MEASEIRWNDEARAKILSDSDRVLREAVVDLAATRSDASADDLFAEINSRMKTRFIDYEPGPDVRKYAEAIVAGEFSREAGGGRDAGVADDSAATDDRGNATTSGSTTSGSTASGGSANLDSQNGNGVAADPGHGALAPDADESDEVVNDG